MWIGGTDSRGYGQISVRKGDKKQPVKANRIAWELATGETLTSTDVIGHTCDVPGCVRNDDSGTYVIGEITVPRVGHLFKGTHADNMADCKQKGRFSTVPHPPETVISGERHPAAKLTLAQVVEIRERHRRGESYASIGAAYGVNRGTIGCIIRGRNWKT